MLENVETTGVTAMPSASGAPEDIKKPLVSYDRTKPSTFSGKGTLLGAVIGFGFAIVTRRSKILWTVVFASAGAAAETIINKARK